jgi:hypothetical protein
MQMSVSVALLALASLEDATLCVLRDVYMGEKNNKYMSLVGNFSIEIASLTNLMLVCVCTPLNCAYIGKS